MRVCVCLCGCVRERGGERGPTSHLCKEGMWQEGPPPEVYLYEKHNIKKVKEDGAWWARAMNGHARPIMWLHHSFNRRSFKTNAHNLYHNEPRWSRPTGIMRVWPKMDRSLFPQHSKLAYLKIMAYFGHMMNFGLWDFISILPHCFKSPHVRLRLSHSYISKISDVGLINHCTLSPPPHLSMRILAEPSALLQTGHRRDI